MNIMFFFLLKCRTPATTRSIRSIRIIQPLSCCDFGTAPVEGFDTAWDVSLMPVIAKEEKPSLMFLDIMMPGINGYEVCSQLKNSPDTRNIIIIMLTAKGQESDKIKGLEVGVDEYITKPFSPQDLLDRARDLLG